jgi:AcrR family transcriptional regulator
MASGRAYRARAPRKRSTETRGRITAAVHEMLGEGVFQEATMEEIAERAGVSRATLYQHFGSRLELIDGVCEIMGANPALREIRRVVGLPDAVEALARMLAHAVRFWSTESAVLRELYGVVAIDPAARSFVERQREDRRGEVGRLAESLARGGHLRAGVTRRRAQAVLVLLTSFETYGELRASGFSDRQVTAFLQETAARELL